MLGTEIIRIFTFAHFFFPESAHMPVGTGTFEICGAGRTRGAQAAFLCYHLEAESFLQETSVFASKANTDDGGQSVLLNGNRLSFKGCSSSELTVSA